VLALLVFSRRYGDKMKRHAFGFGSDNRGIEFVDQIGNDAEDAGPVLFSDPAGAIPRPWDCRSMHSASSTPPRSMPSSSLARTHDLDDVAKHKNESGYYTTRGAHARLAARQRRRDSLDSSPSTGTNNTDIDLSLADMPAMKSGSNQIDSIGLGSRRSHSRLRDRVDIAVGAAGVGPSQSPQGLPLHLGGLRTLSQVRSLDDQMRAAAEVGAFLAQRDLEAFTDALLKFGVGSVEDLRDANLVSDSELLKCVGMKKIHVRTFRQLLADSIAEAGKDEENDDKDNDNNNNSNDTKGGKTSELAPFKSVDDANEDSPQNPDHARTYALETSSVHSTASSGALASGLLVAQGFFTQLNPTPAATTPIVTAATAPPVPVEDISVHVPARQGGGGSRPSRMFTEGNDGIGGDGDNEGSDYDEIASLVSATAESEAASLQTTEQKLSPRSRVL
jgi:hypothetical protein